MGCQTVEIDRTGFGKPMGHLLGPKTAIRKVKTQRTVEDLKFRHVMVFNIVLRFLFCLCMSLGTWTACLHVCQ